MEKNKGTIVKWLVLLTIGMSITLDKETVHANAVNEYVKQGITEKGWKSPAEQDRLGSINYRHNYATGFAKPTKIINHETANENSTIEGEISYMIRNQENAFVHEFVDAYNIIGIANTDYLSWGAGPMGNATGIQVEQIRVKSKDEFAKEIMNLATFNVMMLKQYGLTPSLGQRNGTGSIWTHAMVTYYLGGTNHTDPDGYWADRAAKYFNTTYTIDNFAALVSDMYYGKIQPNSPANVTTTTKVTQEKDNFIADITVAGDTDRITKIQVPAWQANNQQKDLKWYTATKINANTYRAIIPVSNHKLLGNYIFHTYVGTNDGVFKAMNSNVLQYQEANVVANTTHQIVNGKLLIQTKVVGDTERITNMQVPIWHGNTSGDKATWYTMNKKSEGVYEYVYDGLKGSEYNKINTHVYATYDQWQLNGVSLTSFAFTQPAITGTTTAQIKGSTVELSTTVTGETSRIDYVQFPTWDNANPNKKVWYRAQKMSDTVYKATVPLSDFNKNSSMYTTHSYIKTTEGKDHLYTGTSFEFEDKVDVVAQTTHQMINGKLFVQTNVTGDTDRIKTMQVPIWHGNIPGDKATWYTMNKKSEGVYEYVYDGLKGSDYDKINTHVYATFDNGQKKGVSSSEYNFTKPAITGITTAQIKGSTVEVTTTVTGETSRIEYIQFPTWDVAYPNRQIWYRAQKVNDETYTAIIPLSDFNKNQSTYTTHSYIKTTEGKDQLYSSASVVYKQAEVNAVNEVVVTGDQAVITTRLAGDIQYVTRVEHPSWVNENPSKQVWYNAEKQQDGTWVTVVPLSEFTTYGNYTTHTYVTTNDSRKHVGNSLSYVFEPPVTSTTTSITVENNIATISAVIDGDSSRVTRVEFPTWHADNNQKDLVWYNATQLSDNLWQAKIDMRKHQLLGEYITHTYIITDNFYRQHQAGGIFTWQ